MVSVYYCNWVAIIIPKTVKRNIVALYISKLQRTALHCVALLGAGLDDLVAPHPQRQLRHVVPHYGEVGCARLVWR
jgi:hypothetical protein